MKTKKIISFLLTVLMLFTSVVALVPPVSAEAAYSYNVDDGSTLTNEEVQAIVKKTLEYNFSCAEDMFDYENGLGYLDSVVSEDGKFSIYVNRYNGIMYYVDNVTGQMLTSNPYNPATSVMGTREDLMSQVVINFFLTSASSLAQLPYTSVQWAAMYSQISVKAISGGLRVNYTLGDTTQRFLLPGVVTAEHFEEKILLPVIRDFEALLDEYCGEDENYNFLGNSKYASKVKDNNYGYLDLSQLKKFCNDVMAQYSKIYKNAKGPERVMLDAFATDIKTLATVYTQKIPQKYIDNRLQSQLDKLVELYPITADGTAIYEYTASTVTATKRANSALLRSRCPDYTFQMMYAEEEKCGYIAQREQKPVFRCSLEYTFNEDGSLSVRMPATSIIFDESTYTLEGIQTLKHFGCGDMSNDGYIFFPDGSGAIIDFKNFYKSGDNISITADVFGQDYCYSTPTGKFKEQVTMPVFGVVNEVKAGDTVKDYAGVDTYTTGFFAIIEEGAPLAKLQVSTQSASHNFASVYASYVPFPSDQFDLSDTISVGSLGKYFITSDSKYNGSYVTRIVMLTDPAIIEAGSSSSYVSSYVGMANYYRDYLSLDKITPATEELPLYIEVLGSMEIVKKILTFPVTVSVPLTTFEDVTNMYNQLSDAKNVILNKAEENRLLAESITGESDDDVALKEKYVQKYNSYLALAEQVQDISNINFKLTGFTNGGMTSTYPTNVRWERACGGKSGFNKLVETAAEISKASDKNFGVYPDFDFLYINDTAAFDGITLKRDASRMVDNRYAAKQFYNSVAGVYEGFFNLVVTPDALEGLYTKFNKSYSKYGWKYISAATLGSDLNSNFDDENPINRVEAMGYVEEILSKMSISEYSIMLETGNAYSVKYADHILDAALDSSHLRFASYPVPFFGMVYHSYVEYSGEAFNYTGSPDYELLRAIESGASLYYILCCENTTYLKDDAMLSDYYGVDYYNWFDNIAETYSELNSLLGKLQTFDIVDHKAIITERAITEKEELSNLATLSDEICTFLMEQIQNRVNAAYDELEASNPEAYKSVAVNIDKQDIIDQTVMQLFTTEAKLLKAGLDKKLDAVIAYFNSEYPVKTGEKQLVIDVTSYEYHYNDEADYTGNYKSAYRYVTGSTANSDEYRFTKYTSDTGEVVVVTYQKGDEIYKFVLNYNTFSVKVNFDGEEFVLEKYSYKLMTNND